MWEGSSRSVSIVMRIWRSSMCESLRWAMRMAVGREGCHLEGRRTGPRWGRLCCGHGARRGCSRCEWCGPLHALALAQGKP